MQKSWKKEEKKNINILIAFVLLYFVVFLLNILEPTLQLKCYGSASMARIFLPELFAWKTPESEAVRMVFFGDCPNLRFPFRATSAECIRAIKIRAIRVTPNVIYFYEIFLVLN